MNVKDIKQVVDYMYIMNRKFGWTECTMPKRLESLDTRALSHVYKILNIKATKKGITFFLWFADDEVIEVMVNEYACDAYDISDVWRDII